MIFWSKERCGTILRWFYSEVVSMGICQCGNFGIFSHPWDNYGWAENFATRCRKLWRFFWANKNIAVKYRIKSYSRFSEKKFRNFFSNRCPGSGRRDISNVRYSKESPSLELITAGGVCFCDNSPLHGSRSRGELENRCRKTGPNRKTFFIFRDTVLL